MVHLRTGRNHESDRLSRPPLRRRLPIGDAGTDGWMEAGSATRVLLGLGARKGHVIGLTVMVEILSTEFGRKD